MADKPRTWPYALIADDTGRTANIRKLDGHLAFAEPQALPSARHIHTLLNEAFDWGRESFR